MARKLAIRQVRSVIGRPEDQKRTMEALGLRRMNRTVIHSDNPAIRGMVYKVQHMVEVQEIEDE
ncbi:50S ribosomal protein L30 [Candidatus Fermentibacteria bacterium]|nr:50S ribosomal protein L30 [Candidatus Fermentibacteria bacterium]